ncbi:MAG: AraC family transcriptional regulator [Treponema sp.]|nr:AraC family transcriptional regulator [Treponema sp.]
MDQYREYRETFSAPVFAGHRVSHTDEKRTFHIHYELELLLILSDGIRCRVGDKAYYPVKNTLLIFNNMDLHHISLIQPDCVSNRYVLYFKPEYISPFSSAQTDLLECFFFRPFADPFLLPLSGEDAGGLVVLYENLIAATGSAGFKSDAFGCDLQAKFILGSLLIKVNALYRQAHSITTDFIGRDCGRIYEIINYLHQNYINDISLSLLAKKFAIDKFYLCALFRKVTGLSPIQYLINCRLMKAKELLLRNYSVDEVCDLAGYNNLSHFSRSFKQHTGQSPKQYQLNAPK